MRSGFTQFGLGGGRFALLLAFLVGVSAAPATAAEPEPEMRLPVTIDKVWFRGESESDPGKLKKAKRSGDLTITESGIEFISKKKSFHFPIAHLSMISLGNLGKGVDTDWVVVGIQEGETTRVAAFRDGRKLGYGQRTGEIHQTLRDAAKLLGVAQFGAPAGYRSYTGADTQVTVTMPESWNAYVLTSVFVGDSAPWGKTVFSPAPVDELKYDVDDPELRRMYEGEIPAILMERTEADAGMTCSSLSRKAVGRLVEQAGVGPLFGPDAQVTRKPEASDVEIAGCAGVRVEARIRDASGVQRVLDLRLFAHEGTLFTFGIRSKAETYADRKAELDGLVGTLRLPLAFH